MPNARSPARMMLMASRSLSLEREQTPRAIDEDGLNLGLGEASVVQSAAPRWRSRSRGRPSGRGVSGFQMSCEMRISRGVLHRAVVDAPHVVEGQLGPEGIGLALRRGADVAQRCSRISVGRRSSRAMGPRTVCTRARRVGLCHGGARRTPRLRERQCRILISGRVRETSEAKTSAEACS